MKQVVLEYFEITALSGTMAFDPVEQKTKMHLHISLADENGVCVGGHLMEGSIIWTTAEITVVESVDQTFGRIFDNTTGFQELVVNQII